MYHDKKQVTGLEFFGIKDIEIAKIGNTILSNDNQVT